jgi:hypothetical protein
MSKNRRFLVEVIVVALKVLFETYLTNKHIDSVTLLATSGILTELRFSMKEFPTIGGRCVSEMSIAAR